MIDWDTVIKKLCWNAAIGNIKNYVKMLLLLSEAFKAK